MVTKSTLKNPSRICLVDFRLTGHHPFYLANFANSFQQLGCIVDIYTINIDKCVISLRKALPQLDLDSITFIQTSATTSKSGRTLGCRAYFNLIRLQREIEAQESTAGYKYKLVYFAYLDDVTHIDFNLPYLIKAPFTMKFSGLLMAPQDRVLRKTPFPLNLFTTTLLEQRSANFSEIGLLMEDAQQLVENEIGKNTVLYPDFCTNKPLQQEDCTINNEIRRRKQNRITTSLLGSIQSHKSVDLFIDCVRAANVKEHFFIIAGKFNRKSFSDEQWRHIQSVMEKPPRNLLIYDEWIESEAIFDSIVQQSDYLYAFYRNFKKSSNILTKGAFYQTPVIVSEQYLMGKRVQKYKLGLALTERQVVKMYEKSSWIQFEFDEPLRRQFVEQNSVHRLSSIFSGLLNI